jgi:ribosome-associated translation inhibitor RaiA
MQNPLQVSYHGLGHDKKIEALIDEKFEKLQAISPNITKCHVVLERLSKHHQKANPACARLDLKISHFDDIVISEKCADNSTSLQSAVLKIFKNALTIVREQVKYRQDKKRTAGIKSARELPEEVDEE